MTLNPFKRKQKTVDDIISVFTKTVDQLDNRREVLMDECELHLDIARQHKIQADAKGAEAHRAKVLAEKIKTIFVI